MAHPYPLLAWVQAYVPDATAAGLCDLAHGPLVIGMVGPASAQLGLHQQNGRRVEFRILESQPAPDPRFGPPVPLA